MAAKTRDYSSGNEFVPTGSAFKAARDPGQGPRDPQPTAAGPQMGPAAEVVFRGPCYGDVRYQDGARIMDDEHPRFKSKLKPADNHLPENA